MEGIKPMIEYVFPHNIDDRVLKRADFCLKDDGLIALPTDSSWSICCSIKSKTGIEKLRKLKGGMKDYTISVICENIRQIEEIATLSTPHFKLIRKLTPGPYVFILPARKHIEKTINMKRAEIGIRIPDHPLPCRLILQHESPLFAVTASRTMASREWRDDSFAEENLFNQGWELEEIPGIDRIIDTGEVLPKLLSTVLDLTGDEIEVVREGIGPVGILD